MSRLVVVDHITDPSQQMHMCQWDWCRALFTVNSELVRHVKHHVYTSRAISKKDLTAIKRAEEGEGGTFTFSDLKPVGNGSQDEAHSSLPSPPASSPSHCLTRQSATPYRTSESPPPAGLNGSRPEEGYDDAHQVSFMSLSSPVRSNTRPSIPISPSFEEKVAGHPAKFLLSSSPVRLRYSRASPASEASEASIASEDSVEQLLTQNVLPVASDDDAPKARHIAVVPAPAVNPPVVPPQRQAWYQFPPPRRRVSRLRSTKKGLHPPTGETGTMPSVGSGSDRSFQSGSTQLADTQSVNSQADDDFIPFLQTQAPYQSQDPFSQ